MPPIDARTRFLTQLRTAIDQGTLSKLTLGKPTAAADPTLRNLFVRPVMLKTGSQLSFVWRHATRDITKNLAPADALALLDTLIDATFADAHLFTPAQTVQLQTLPDGRLRFSAKTACEAPPAPVEAHDRAKEHLLPAHASWLHALGVTNAQGHPREGMAHKFRQIQKFAELLTHLLVEAGLTPASIDGLDVPPAEALRIADMGSGKGYLTFALAALLGSRAQITGVERRHDLVGLCNQLARDHGFAPHLTFIEGDIAPVTDTVPGGSLDVLIALHACDTATDDALSVGIRAGARLLVVSPCCQKELRAQLIAPAVLADALRHGIFQERQAEFVTDALRAELLECAGYHTKVFEFISTEHTAKNLMIAAIKHGHPVSPAKIERVRTLAAFYGIRTQRLAAHLGLDLA